MAPVRYASSPSSCRLLSWRVARRALMMRVSDALRSCIGSPTINASGSAKTVVASSNVTPCLRWFAAALRASQLNRTHVSV